MNFFEEDTQGLDLTTLGLGIGKKQGVMSFRSKFDITLSGMSEVLKLQKELGIECKSYKNDGEEVKSGELILDSYASAEALHKAWKISQNIFEYMSGIATYTNKLLRVAQEINPNISIATTRKNFPGSKKLIIQAVLDGGGVPHRLGTYDSVLIFEQHRAFLSNADELKSAFEKLKNKFLEKKITVEVDSYEDALYFAKLGADILQCEKMELEELKSCVNLKKEFTNLILIATGGINLDNVKEYAKSGVDGIATSSPYHAMPQDIKITMKAL